MRRKKLTRLFIIVGLLLVAGYTLSLSDSVSQSVLHHLNSLGFFVDANAQDGTCVALEEVAAQVLAVDVTKTETGFHEQNPELSGIDCNLTATARSASADDYLAMADELKEALAAQGWQEDPTFIAYGPDEISLGFRKGLDSGLLIVGSALALDACVAEQATTDCDFGPDQRTYTITFSYTVQEVNQKSHL